jgi:hypothetical protein
MVSEKLLTASKENNPHDVGCSMILASQRTSIEDNHDLFARVQKLQEFLGDQV